MLGVRLAARTFGQPPGSSPARHLLADATDMNDQIRQIIAAHGRMPVDAYALDDHADLYRAGMSSHASVNVMLALEDTFDIEFPDAMLTRSVFESIASIAAALMQLEAMAA
jgi:acyl carrier protein